MTPLSCEFLNSSVTLLCDGTITCGLDDPFKARSHGNAKTSSVSHIFQGEAIRARREMLKGGEPCTECKLYSVDDENRDMTEQGGHRIKKLILESSIKCNIRCDNSVCNIANDASLHLRREDFMSWGLFCKVIDEVGPTLDEFYFYNYGEPFAHPRALDMLAYAKKTKPDVRIATSTNGILLAKEGVAKRIVQEELVDWMCFTIGGCDEETYKKYHKAGSFEKAIKGMSEILSEKRKAGRAKPTVHWRYLLFDWNDHDEHLEAALRMSEQLGVDEFRFMLSYSPLEGRSLRRAPGTSGFGAIADWVEYQMHYETDVFGEAGLWQLEHDKTSGPFCWTGKRARLIGFTSSAVLSVRLSRPALAMLPPVGVTIHAPWGKQEGCVGIGEWKDNILQVPPGFGASDIAITIEVDRTMSPFRVLNTLDHRDLGVMVSMSGFAPAPNPYRAVEWV